MIKILHIATGIDGGISVVAQLHQKLMDKNIDSKILHLHETKKTGKNIFRHKVSERKFIQKLFNKIGWPIRQDDINRRYLKGQEFNYIFTFPKTDYDLSKHPLVEEADIIHLHWTSTFLDYNFFSKIKKPIVWTLHDMNPFTGGCHHSSNCEGFIVDCDHCPQLKVGQNDHLARKNLQYKITNFLNSNIHIVALNTWMKNLSAKSALFKKFEHSIIPNSINPALFTFTDKQAARIQLNLSKDKILIGFCAFYMAKGKGGDLLKLAFDEVQKKYSTIELVCVGSRFSELSGEGITHLGRITDLQRMSLFYSAMDAIVIPSREDNLPTVMLEALIFGKPVIAFTIGGIPDCITSFENGILAGEPTASNLIQALESYIESHLKFNQEKIKEHAQQLFSPELQANSYINLYTKLLTNSSI